MYRLWMFLMVLSIFCTNSAFAELNEISVRGEVVMVKDDELILKARTNEYRFGGDGDLGAGLEPYRTSDAGEKVITVSLINPYTGEREVNLDLNPGDAVSAKLEVDEAHDKYYLIHVKKLIDFDQKLTTW